jgi:hypothetical protein
MIRARVLLRTAAVLVLGSTAGLVGTAHAVSSTGAGCPALAPASISGTSVSARGVFVPRGATTLLLCRYQGLNPPATAHRLVRGRRLRTAKQIAQLAAELDALPLPTGVIHCPMDDGSEITATFGYKGAASLTASIGLTGCRTVSRGKLVRTAGGAGGSLLIERLTALLRS